MTRHERKIEGVTPSTASVDAAVSDFIAQLTHLPDPDLRRYCQERIVAAQTLPEMAAAVGLVRELCACFTAPAASLDPTAPAAQGAEANL